MNKALEVIDQLIINSPYHEPQEYWNFDPTSQTFSRKAGRRSAGYFIASQTHKTPNDPGRFVELPLVNKIRPRIRQWRDADYPGITSTTRRLLTHWREEGRHNSFFFCQMEAIETLIWLIEAPPSERTGIQIPSDGGEFSRICSKMATGTGKTVVMGMVAAWQILNKVLSPRDTRFSKNILMIAPGLTVRNRLGVLDPQRPDNYFEEFSIVPNHMLPSLRQGRVLIKNWHAMAWETDEELAKKKSVDKRGALSDEAYVRRLLGEMQNATDIMVINDEAHHAWRVPSESKIKGLKKEEIEAATIWISGLDRIHKTRGIKGCFDFSATPFAPSGNRTDEEALFDWIVSDFGLNDAIESGLVKTPRVVVRDDGRMDSKTYKSLLYHIYDNDVVRDDLNRNAKEEEPLPDLVMNAYHLLASDWEETKKLWDTTPIRVPPVLISVVNRTETAARVKFAFDNNKIKVDALCDPKKTLHIDSAVMKKAEFEERIYAGNEGGDESRKLSKKEQAENLRRTVDTVGKVGEPGEQIQHVISVAMLSEGWDTKTVTHIIGLRAFSSQLLCEQVVGRGLRRTSYEVDEKTGLFGPEYVNVFGVPFSFLPVEGGGTGEPRPATPKIPIFPDPERRAFKIEWPNVIRIEHGFKPKLELDLSKVSNLELNAADTIEVAELAPTIDGRPDLDKIKEIALENLIKGIRLQRIIFETARDVYDQMEPNWVGDKGDLLGQLIQIAEKYINSDCITVKPVSYGEDELKRRTILILSMNRIVQHLFDGIRFQSTERLDPVFDVRKPITSTEDAGTWYTGKVCERFRKTHINLCVFDSTYEKAAALELDRNKAVKAWAKNDHLNFEILYFFKGVVRKYIPDFLVELTDGTKLILEVKGQETDRDRTKWSFLNEWIQAMNGDGRFGRWVWDVSYDPAASDVSRIIELAQVGSEL
jgi:type III restriction enzyme